MSHVAPIEAERLSSKAKALNITISRGDYALEQDSPESIKNTNIVQRLSIWIS